MSTSREPRDPNAPDGQGGQGGPDSADGLVGPGGQAGSDPSGERRTDPRADLSLRVEYTKLNAFFADYTKNISHGGTFLRSDDPMPVGTLFRFRLVVPRLETPIGLCGQVVWIKRPGEPSPPGIPQDHEPGMGIRFVYDSQEQRAAITETVEKLMIDSLGQHLYNKLMGRNS